MLTKQVYQPTDTTSGAGFAVHRQVCVPRTVEPCPFILSLIWLQAFRSLAKCVAAICFSVPDRVRSTVNRFITDIKVCVACYHVCVLIRTVLTCKYEGSSVLCNGAGSV